MAVQAKSVERSRERVHEIIKQAVDDDIAKGEDSVFRRNVGANATIKRFQMSGLYDFSENGTLLMCVCFYNCYVTDAIYID